MLLSAKGNTWRSSHTHSPKHVQQSHVRSTVEGQQWRNSTIYRKKMSISPYSIQWALTIPSRVSVGAKGFFHRLTGEMLLRPWVEAACAGRRAWLLTEDTGTLRRTLVSPPPPPPSYHGVSGGRWCRWWEGAPDGGWYGGRWKSQGPMGVVVRPLVSPSDDQTTTKTTSWKGKQQHWRDGI